MASEAYTSPIMAVIGILIMAEPPKYINGGEDTSDDDGWDTVGDNPTGRRRKSSARQRRKKARRLFGGTPWAADGPAEEQED